MNICSARQQGDDDCGYLDIFNRVTDLTLVAWH